MKKYIEAFKAGEGEWLYRNQNVEKRLDECIEHLKADCDSACENYRAVEQKAKDAGSDSLPELTWEDFADAGFFPPCSSFSVFYMRYDDIKNDYLD